MANTADQGVRVSAPAGNGEGAVVLTRHAEMLFETTSRVLTTLCGRPVRMSLDRIVTGSLSTLPSLFPGPWVGMTMEVTQGLSGIQALVWKEADAIAVAQLILGEEPASGPAMSPDYLDALSEATNQISGAFGTTLRAALGTAVACGARTVSVRAEPGEWHTMFREAALSPQLCVARVTHEGSAPLEVVLIVTTSLVPETDNTTTNNDSSMLKEGTVSATTASAQVPFVPLAGGERAGSSNGIDMLLDVNLQVSVELGRTRLQIRDILQLGPGSIVELDKQAGEPVDIIVNDKPIAKGEVIIIDENFGVRLTSISSVTDRIKNLR